MSGVGLRRRRWAPTVAEINPDHPLAAGLLAYQAGGIVYRPAPTVIPATAGGVTVFGQAVTQYGAATPVTYPFPVQTDTTEFTMAAFGIWDPNNTGAPIVGFRNTILQFVKLKSSGAEYYVDGVSYTPLSMSLTTPSRSAMYIKRGLTLELYANDGALVDSNSGNGPGGLNMASYPAGLVSFEEEKAGAAVSGFWTRALGAAERAMLFTDPICLLRGR